MFTATRKTLPGFMAGLNAEGVSQIMRQELALVGTVGEGSGDYDIKITGPTTFEATDSIPKEAIDAAVERIFDRIMKQQSTLALSQPDKK